MHDFTVTLSANVVYRLLTRGQQAALLALADGALGDDWHTALASGENRIQAKVESAHGTPTGTKAVSGLIRLGLVAQVEPPAGVDPTRQGGQPSRWFLLTAAGVQVLRQVAWDNWRARGKPERSAKP